MTIAILTREGVVASLALSRSLDEQVWRHL
jgi:hypothetical protein